MPAIVATVALVAACREPNHAAGVVYGSGFAFRLPPPPAGWRHIDHSDAALAFRDEPNQGVALFNARCHLDGEDVPLLALTNHLFLTFTERDVRQQEVVSFDGREAMHTVLSAKLDGVAQTYDVWVLKKDECVYDLLYAAPQQGFERGQPAFLEVVHGFTTVRRDG